MRETLQESVGILADAAAKPALQVIEKVFDPIASVSLRWFGLHIVACRIFDGRPCSHKSERNGGKSNLHKSLVEAIYLLMHQRVSKRGLGIHILEPDLAPGGS